MRNKTTFNIDFFLNLRLLFRIKNAVPDYQIGSLFDIQGILKDMEIEAIIFDIDQTIVPFGKTKISGDIDELLHNLKSKYRMCLLSNFPHTEERIQRIRAIEGQLEIDAIFSKRRKPSPAAFQLALEYLRSEPENTMMIGDRLVTDILGANQLGLKTVLVAPLDRRTDPFFMVTLPRFFERPYLKLGTWIHRNKL